MFESVPRCLLQLYLFCLVKEGQRSCAVSSLSLHTDVYQNYSCPGIARAPRTQPRCRGHRVWVEDRAVPGAGAGPCVRVSVPSRGTCPGAAPSARRWGRKVGVHYIGDGIWSKQMVSGTAESLLFPVVSECQKCKMGLPRLAVLLLRAVENRCTVPFRKRERRISAPPFW